MNTVTSYKDILINGVQCNEIKETVKEVYMPKIITNCIVYDEYMYENLIKTVKEYSKKHNLKSFFIKEDELMFFEIDEFNYEKFLAKTCCQLYNPYVMKESTSSFGNNDNNNNGNNNNTTNNDNTNTNNNNTTNNDNTNNDNTNTNNNNTTNNDNTNTNNNNTTNNDNTNNNILIISAIDGFTEWNPNGYNFIKPTYSTYNCSYSFAQSINNKTKLVKIFWCIKDDCALFYSVLPLVIHDLIVKTFFSDIDVKFSPNNYNKTMSKNNKNSETKQIIDEDGFIHNKPKKLSKKMIDKMQQNELLMMISNNNV